MFKTSNIFNDISEIKNESICGEDKVNGTSKKLNFDEIKTKWVKISEIFLFKKDDKFNIKIKVLYKSDYITVITDGINKIILEIENKEKLKLIIEGKS